MTDDTTPTDTAEEERDEFYPVLLTPELLYEQGEVAYRGEKDQEKADELLDRGRRMADTLARLPKAFRLTREHDQVGWFHRGETIFRLIYADDADEDPRTCEITSVRRVWSERDGAHYIMPGKQRSQLDADEAVARAVILLLAALDVEGRAG